MPPPFDDIANNLLQSIRLNNLFGGGMPNQSQFPTSLPSPSPIGGNQDPFGVKTQMFQPPTIQTPTIPARQVTPDPVPNPDSDIMSIINKLYQPETQYSDMYTKALSERPVRQKPTLGRRGMSSLYGLFTGPQGAEDMMYKEYNRAMPEWEKRIDALQPGLVAERGTNATNRQLALGTASAIRDERKQKEVERKNAVAEELNVRKQQLAELKANGFELVTGRDGWIYGINPLTGVSQRTNVEARELSLVEATGVKTQGAIQEIEARGAIQERMNNADNLAAAERAKLSAETQAALAEVRAELAGQNRWSTPVQAFDRDNKPLPYMISANGKTGEVKQIPLGDAVIRTVPPGSGGSSGGVTSESQKATGITSRAQQVEIEHPEWKGWLKFSGTGSARRFIGLTTPGRFSGPAQDVYNKMYELIYQEPFTATAAPVGGGARPIPPKANTNPAAAVKPPKPTGSAGDGRVWMYHTKMKTWGSIPATQKAQALASKEFEE